MRYYIPQRRWLVNRRFWMSYCFVILLCVIEYVYLYFDNHVGGQMPFNCNAYALEIYKNINTCGCLYLDCFLGYYTILPNYEWQYSKW